MSPVSSTAYPSLQTHMKLPNVFLHSPFTQGLVRHSLTSKQNNCYVNNVFRDIKIIHKLFKEYWQRNFLLLYLKELLNLFNNLFYSFLISLLVIEIFTIDSHLGYSRICILRHWLENSNISSLEPQNISLGKYDCIVAASTVCRFAAAKNIFIANALLIERF